MGNYRLRQMIGQGGSADVYLGEHIHLGTLAAIKLLHIQIGSNELDDFLREARTIAHLRHPHIVRVLDFGVEGNMPFLVMDYATNGTLRQSYPKGTHLPQATIISYVKQVSQALQYAHDRKVVHRDVKPDNMLLDINSQLLLSDFGISGIEQHTNTWITQQRVGTSAAGTIYYMAPEQIHGHPHLASDQYALGIVVYEWLCGSCPFSGETLAVMYQHVHMPPLPLRAKVATISPEVEQVVLRALSKDPRQRFATISEFAQALERADQEQHTPTILTQWPVINPISIVEPASVEPTQARKDSSILGGRAQQRKSSSIPRSMAILLIGLAIMLVAGSVAFYLSSSNKPIRANPATVTNPIDAYNAGTTHGVMAGFNAQHSRVNPYERLLTPANVSTLVPAWKVAAGGSIGSAATVANGIVYINANYNKSHDGYMYALNVDTGAILWKAYIGSYDFGCAPTVADGVVYMGSFDYNLYAFNAMTGAVLWKSPTKGRIGSSPTLVNGVIYIGSDDGTLYAFNASDGMNIWSVPTGSTISSSPAVANGVVYVGSDNHKLYAIDANNGSIRWTVTTGDQVVSSPAVANGVVYIGSNDHTVYAFNADTGTVLWKVQTGRNIVSSPAVANGVVYIGSNDHTVYAFNADTGTVLWKVQTGRNIVSSPAVANGVVYIGSDDNRLYAFNASTGADIWSVLTGGGIRSSPIIANGLVYVGSDDHKLYAINADNGVIRWTFTTGDQIVSSPTVANGAVYIGSNDGYFYAFHLAGRAA